MKRLQLSITGLTLAALAALSPASALHAGAGAKLGRSEPDGGHVYLEIAQLAAPTPQVPASTTHPASPPTTLTPAAPVSPPDAGPPPETRPVSVLPVLRELSPWSMFQNADVLVKAVIISLAFASLVTWTIFFARSVQLAFGRRRLRKALVVIANMPTLAEAQLAAGRRRTLLSAIVGSAISEMRTSPESSAERIQARAASRFSEILRTEAGNARAGMSIVGTIGSTAPFVGLFGTVWGIMNSFIGISKAQTTNLAVVAPGIAEALLATAIGLAAAIPAVIVYNYLARSTRTYLELASRTAGSVGRVLSRELDRNQNAILLRRKE